MGTENLSSTAKHERTMFHALTGIPHEETLRRQKEVLKVLVSDYNGVSKERLIGFAQAAVAFAYKKEESHVRAMMQACDFKETTDEPLEVQFARALVKKFLEKNTIG